jgi:ABC-type branched-subunit amino acid transport system ATPase component
MSSVAHLDGPTVRFGGIAALSGVGLEADEGEVIGIIRTQRQGRPRCSTSSPASAHRTTGA